MRVQGGASTQLPASENFLSVPSLLKIISGQAFWLKFMSSLLVHGFIHSSILGEHALSGCWSGHMGDSHRAPLAGSHSAMARGPLLGALVNPHQGEAGELAQGRSAPGRLEDLAQEAGASQRRCHLKTGWQVRKRARQLLEREPSPPTAVASSGFPPSIPRPPETESVRAAEVM